MKERLVVIGGVAAGPSAAFKAKRVNPDIEVLLFTDEEDLSYGSCGLPYFISGVIKNRKKLVAKTINAFKNAGIDVKVRTRVEGIDPKEGVLYAGGEKFRYDSLIIATGASPLVPPFEGRDLDGVFTLRSVKDGERILDFIERESPERAVIVGAGYIGVEMAESFTELGLRVSLVELMPQILINMDSDMAELVRKELEAKGVKVLTSTRVLGFEGEGKVRKVLTDGGKLDADLVLLAIGVKPNSELAKEAGLALGPKGSIDVNRKMETSASGIYAAGDCADAFHMVSGKKAYIPLGTTANKQGRIAGNNAAGGDYAVFPGIVGTAIAKVFDLEIARTGLSSVEAKAEGFSFKSTTITSKTVAGYYPGGYPITVKLLVEEKTGRLIGGQIVGGRGSGTRINALAIAVANGMRIWDFAYADLAYAPPFSPVWDPLLVAGQKILREF